MQHCVLRYTSAKYRFWGEIPVKIPVRLSVPVPSPTIQSAVACSEAEDDGVCPGVCVSSSPGRWLFIIDKSFICMFVLFVCLVENQTLAKSIRNKYEMFCWKEAC